MTNQRFILKEKALRLRREGISLIKIHRKLNIPKSTLSCWLRHVKLTNKQIHKLEEDKKIALSKARKKAVIWHNQQKEKRISKARDNAKIILNNLDTNNKDILEIALSFLYLGEGAKKDSFSMANSNPEILEFFLSSIEILYKQNRRDLRYDLHLRYDQDGNKLREYWAKKLKIHKNQIGYCSFDKRTKDKKTNSDYKGVCVVYGKGVDKTRRLLEIAKLYSSIICKKRL